MVPFFTVILPVYNRADLLPRAVASLLQQEEQDWEAIIVDDASTDTTSAIAQELAAQDERIRYVLRTANGGTAAARNSGIEQARGLFVTFLDSDDEYLPEHLSSRREMLLSHEEIEFLHGGVTVIGDPWVIDRFDTTQKIHINDCVVGGTFVIRRDQLSRIGPFREGAYADDALFFERAEEAGVTIAATDYPTYRYYRNVPNQQTSVYTTPPAPHGS